MPRIRRYECPSCAAAFEVFAMTADEPPPRYCPKCGFDTQAEEAAPLTEPLAAPAISKGVARGADNIAKADEEGGNFRADYAQQVLGLDAEAAKELRAPPAPVNNSVSQYMAANQMDGFSLGSQRYTADSAAVQSGPFPNAGLHAQQDLRKAHAAFTANSGHAGPIMSDLPALETQQPGYRPRIRTI